MAETPATGAVSPTADDFESVADVGTQRVARVYAEALLKAAIKARTVDETVADMQEVVALVQARPEFEIFLTSRTIGRERKAQAIRTAFAGRAQDLLVNALLVLNEHERLELLRPVAAELKKLRDQWAGRMEVQVTSAAPLSEEQKTDLRRQLQESFQKEPVIETRIDPEILGGMVVRVGDWLFDRSVRGQLESIRNEMIAKGSYEIQSGRDRFSSAIGN
jgi:F-type H+-transporting ATPase subunit delta